MVQEVPEDGPGVHESLDLFYDRRTRGVFDLFGGRGGREAACSFQAASFEASGSADLRRGGRVRYATLGDGVVLAAIRKRGILAV